MTAVVDPEDWVTIDRKNWRAKKGRYGWYALKISRSGGKTIYTYMHRLINKTPKDEHCHHLNGDTLDERRRNLQNLTPPNHGIITRLRRIARFDYGTSSPLRIDS